MCFASEMVTPDRSPASGMAIILSGNQTLQENRGDSMQSLRWVLVVTQGAAAAHESVQSPAVGSLDWPV